MKAEEGAIPDALEADAQQLTLIPQPLPKHPSVTFSKPGEHRHIPYIPHFPFPSLGGPTFTRWPSRTWLPPGGDAGRAQPRQESSQQHV